MNGSAAFFRLEGALHPQPAWRAAMWLASNAPSVRRRLLGVSGVALSAQLLTARDPLLTQRLAWSALRGFSADRIAVLGEDWARDRILPEIAPGARRLIGEARARSDRLILVAETIDAIAGPVGEALGFDLVVSSSLELDGDEATGTLAEPRIGPEIDPRRLRELAARESIDLARSSAYGATRADALLLSLVGLPCALDPDRELARMARDLDWPIVHARAELALRAPEANR